MEVPRALPVGLHERALFAKRRGEELKVVPKVIF
jgi:hypothetical protein